MKKEALMGKLIGIFTCILALFLGCVWLLYDEGLEATSDAMAEAGIFDIWTAPNGDTVVMVAGQKRMINKDLVSAFAFGISETVEMGRSLLPTFLTTGGDFLKSALEDISAIWEEAARDE
jgi:hypothetical protein